MSHEGWPDRGDSTMWCQVGVLPPSLCAVGQLALSCFPEYLLTVRPAWDTYFFICPCGPAKLWNVKKYVFQARNSLARLRGSPCPWGAA